MSHISIIYAQWLVWHSDSAQLLVMLAQVCVSCPVRADWVFGRAGLKDTGVSVQCCSTGQYEKIDEPFEH